MLHWGRIFNTHQCTPGQNNALMFTVLGRLKNVGNVAVFDAVPVPIAPRLLSFVNVLQE